MQILSRYPNLLAAAVTGLILFGCRWPGASAPARLPSTPTFHVVFDESVGQLYSPFDTGVSGMSGLALALRELGASVSLSSVPLRELVLLFHGKGHVLVLGPAMNRRYSDDDLGALADFLSGGGGILVSVEHDDLFGNASMQAPLLSPLGIQTLPAGAFGAGENTRAAYWPVAKIARWKLDAELYYAAPLVVSPPAIPLAVLPTPAEADKAVVAATVEAGVGRLIVIGDTELLWNMTRSTGIGRPGNRAFLARAFRWLAHDPPPPASERGPRSGGAARPRRVLFDVSAGGLGPDESLSGLGAFAGWLRQQGLVPEVGGGPTTDYAGYALVVIASPLRALPAPAAIGRSRRLLLLADGQSDWFGDLPEIKEAIAKQVVEDVQQAPQPFDALTRPLGFRWRPRTLVAEGMDLSSLGRWDGGEALLFQRAGVLAPVGEAFPAGVQVLARGVRGTDAARNIVPLVDSEDNPIALSPPPEAPENQRAVIALSTPAVFALADVDVLTNLHLHTARAKPALQAIARWLGPRP